MVLHGRSVLPRSLSILVLFCIIAITSQAEEQAAADSELEEFHYDCKKIVWRIAKKVLKIFGNCTKELKVQYPEDQERSKYIQCAVRCCLQQLELLNEKGIIDQQTTATFLDKLVKPQFHEVGQIILGGCIEDFSKHTEEQLKSPFCEPYGDALKCMQGMLTEVC